MDRIIVMLKKPTAVVEAAAEPLPWPFGPNVVGYQIRHNARMERWDIRSGILVLVEATKYDHQPQTINRGPGKSLE